MSLFRHSQKKILHQLAVVDHTVYELAKERIKHSKQTVTANLFVYSSPIKTEKVSKNIKSKFPINYA